MTGTPDCLILVAEDNPADVALVREALKEHHVDCSVHVVMRRDVLPRHSHDVFRRVSQIRCGLARAGRRIQTAQVG